MPRCLAVQNNLKRCFFDAWTAEEVLRTKHQPGDSWAAPPAAATAASPSAWPDTIAIAEEAQDPPAQDAPPPRGLVREGSLLRPRFRHGGARPLQDPPPAPSPPSITRAPDRRRGAVGGAAAGVAVVADGHRLPDRRREQLRPCARPTEREEERRAAEEGGARRRRGAARGGGAAQEGAAEARRPTGRHAPGSARTRAGSAGGGGGHGGALAPGERRRRSSSPNASTGSSRWRTRPLRGLHVVHGNAPFSGDPVPLLSPTTGGLQAHSIDQVELIAPRGQGLRTSTSAAAHRARPRAAPTGGRARVTRFGGSRTAPPRSSAPRSPTIGDGATPAAASAAAGKRVLDTMEEGMLDSESSEDGEVRVHLARRRARPRVLYAAGAVHGAESWGVPVVRAPSPTTRAQRNRVGWKGRMAAGDVRCCSSERELNRCSNTWPGGVRAAGRAGGCDTWRAE